MKKSGLFSKRAALIFALITLVSALFAPASVAAAPDEQADNAERIEQRSDLGCTSTSGMASAASAVLIEAGSGQMLLASNQNSRLPMASTTKTMTALVVIESCRLDERVKIPSEAVGVEGSSMYLKLGEELTVRDLLYGLMLLSGNDAAVALAIHVGGTVEGFAELMNARAASLGLVNTHFVTPNGLHDAEHYTTAYELALIGAEALKNEAFREIVSTQYYSSESGAHTRMMKNKNALLWDYDGAIGIKTGYTSAAGRCLLFAAERNGMLLVGAVLNCRPMFEVAPEMLDYGFSNFSMMRVVEGGAELARCLVLGGEKSLLSLKAKQDIIIPVRNGAELNIEVRVELSGPVAAPIFLGEAMGFAELSVSGVPVGKTDVVAGSSVAARSYMFYLKYFLSMFGLR